MTKTVKLKPTIIYRTKVVVKKIYIYGCPKWYSAAPNGSCQPQGSG